MNLSPGVRKLLMILVPSLLLITAYTYFEDSPATTAPAADSGNIALARQRTVRLAGSGARGRAEADHVRPGRSRARYPAG
jgi:hypothetical protein